MATEIKLQALKENVESVEVNAIKVSPGDTVAQDQPILEVQADKAALDVLSPMAGQITEIRVAVGDVLNIGQVYCLIEGENGEPGKAANLASASTSAQAGGGSSAKAAPQERGDSTGSPQPTHDLPPLLPQRQVPPKTDRMPPPQPEEITSRPVGDMEATSLPPEGNIVPASPATRRMAREWGVDLHLVHGTGREGRVVEEDIKDYVRRLNSGAGMHGGGAAQAPPMPDFTRWGPVERQALTPVRRATSRQMSLAWGQVPHVTQHDLADITELETFRKQQSGQGPKLTITAFALKACAILLEAFPQFNASLDVSHNMLILKRYYHIGVAVDTEGGLLVPVLRDVDQKSIHELAEELTATAERARDRKLDMDELKGGTFTITNLGGIGGTAFTPIVNYPEVAILGLSRGRWEPVVREGEVVPRLMLPLSLSYDHRVIDGADAARFTRRLAEMLENPLMMLLKA